MRRLAWAMGVLAALLALSGLGGYVFLRASLPQLDGSARLAGLAAPVTVLRDRRGMPTIQAADRLDLARATGYLHAQDRYFQMDLLRRVAAGELAALLGPAAVAVDRRARLHGLRRVAAEVLAREPARRRRLIEAYTAGVNAGLASLSARPPEYALLRARPQPWRGEDSLLVLFAMYFDLQDETASRESRLELIDRALPPPLARFLTGPDLDWEAPLDGSTLLEAPIPGAEAVDLRQRRPLPPLALDEAGGGDLAAGSNSWAIGPTVSADGAAWLANDMHLGLAVPNVWYRARLEWRQDGEPRGLTGVTLPGAPALVVGSNGKVAWGFTNSNGDFTDLVEIELDPADPDRYRTPDGYRRFGERTETITVKGGEPVRLRVRQTLWGPLLDDGPAGRPRAVRWVAHDPAATNLGLLDLERAGDLRQAMAVAQRTGVPAQNFIAVDSQGNLGWTLIGRIPRRQGIDGARPRSWADGGGWAGWLPPARYPQRVNPPDGRLWTANNRVVGGEALALLGDGGYALGARARQIRDRLFELERAGAADLLALQLDDRAVFLGRWRDLLLAVLSPEAVAAEPRRAALRRVVADWGGRAAVGSVGYRMVRAFRLELYQEVFAALTAPVRALDGEFRFVDMPQAESALWRLVSQRPPHLLSAAYDSWDAQLLAAADRLVERFWQPDGGYSAATWGAHNRLSMRHPLSRALPALSPWLDMPALALPGDSYMPRVQAPGHGASERLVVAPGREASGILELPGGQSGHPLSPYYRRGHRDWTEGRPTPLLPGPAEHRLRLVPARP